MWGTFYINSYFETGYWIETGFAFGTPLDIYIPNLFYPLSSPSAGGVASGTLSVGGESSSTPTLV